MSQVTPEMLFDFRELQAHEMKLMLFQVGVEIGLLLLKVVLQCVEKIVIDHYLLCRCRLPD